MFMNPKDIPFAATYSLGLWALISFSRNFEKPSYKWIGILGLAFGAAMSTRLAGAILFSYLGLILCVHAIQSLATRNRANRWTWIKTDGFKLALTSILTLPVAYIFLLIWWPAGHGNVIAESAETLDRLHSSASEIPLLFDGVMMNASDGPPYYTIWMLLIKTPLWMLGLSAFGLMIALQKVVFSIRQRTPIDLGIVTVLIAFICPLFYLTITAPDLHNGARHFLFLYPPLCILTAYGFGKARELWVKLSKTPRLKYLPESIIVTIFLIQSLTLVQLHPYQYIYYNSLVGGPAGTLGRYETEYWFTSTRHAISALETHLAQSDQNPDQGPKLLITGPRHLIDYFLPEGWSLASRVEEADYFIGNTQFNGHLLIEGNSIIGISRMGLEIVQVKELGK